jgi:hypothetical protein
MTPGDVGRVLAKAAAFDQRTVGEADVLAWIEVIGDLEAADALEAVSRHYAETDRRLMPVHVLDQARRVRLERVESGPTCPICTRSTLSLYHQRHCASQPALTSERIELAPDLMAALRESLRRARQQRTDPTQPDPSVHFGGPTPDEGAQ